MYELALQRQAAKAASRFELLFPTYFFRKKQLFLGTEGAVAIAAVATAAPG